VSDPQRDQLRDEEFIRHRLYGGQGGAMKRYAALVLANPSLPRLLRYELLTTLFGPIPGALGIALRKTFYPLLFPSIGRGVIFGCGVVLRHPERILLGDGVMIDDYAVVDGRGAGDEGVVLGDRVIVNRGAAIQAKVGGITIGEETSVGSGVRIISQGPIRIAEHVSIAGGCCIAGGRYVVDRTGDEADDKRRFTGGTISIGRKARLGINALIQDGVTIGEGAIVAPASVVMTDVAAHTVVSGFPARVWRERKVRGEGETDATAGAAAPATSVAGNGDDAIDEEIAARIRGWLTETKFAEFGEGELSDADSLFDHDILDSLGLVGLVAWLEATFDLHVADEDLVPENMESVARIARYVRGRTSAASA
jgi:acetyltransferase-like isoleucine patch superfamily enzyme/acyl carrier protein